jgi:hypothetical protein
MSKKFLGVLFFSMLAFCFQATARTTYKNNRYTYIQNERFTVRALQTLHAAQMTYQATGGNGNYGSFSDLHQAQLIDSVLASGFKYGYVFQIFTVVRVGTTPAAFYATATPVSYRKTGRRSFFINETGETRGADKNGAAATVSDPIINVCQELGYSNERCAIADLRILHSAQMTYSATIGNGNYGNFQQLYAANLISLTLAIGSRHGYNFACSTIDATSVTPAFFALRATPTFYGVTGRRSFYIDVSGVLRGADKNGAPADENDPPIQEQIKFLNLRID